MTEVHFSGERAEELDLAQIMEDYQQHALLMEEIEKGKVTRITRHTDTELVPIEPSEAIYQAMIFDAEESLRNAANQKWLIDGIIPADGFGILYGASGSYKSFLALDLACSISTGQSWHGFDVDCPGPVLYIAAEGASGLQERAVAWKRHYGKSYGPMAILPTAIMMDNAVQVQLFIEAAMKAQEERHNGIPFSLVVIDTMARSFNGDENSAQDTGHFINSCMRWRAEIEGPTIMVIAHAGKDVARGIRGSSALKAACDFVYVVSRPNHLQALLRNEKQKDIDEAEDMRFALQSVALDIHDHKGRERKSLVPILESRGSMADPDKIEEQPTPFELADLKSLVRIAKANSASGSPMTEDELRIEYCALKVSEGVKPDSAARSYRRNMGIAKEKGYLFKHGKLISVGDLDF